ncbi:MAG: tetratricopeptide repeat protein [Planctomycetaceae bacterium]|nr:tetratricopeptide repeat protein [Planctomycetaceae bacterium]
MFIPVRQCTILSLAVAIIVCVSGPLQADEADDQYAVAAGHYDRGRWKLAAEEFLKFRQRFPKDRRQTICAFCLGESLFQLGKFDEALPCFRDYSNREPTGQYAKETLLQLGQCAYLAGKLDAAKTDLKRFLDKYPDDRWNETALFYLAEIALASDDAATAATRFREIMTRFPDGRLQDDCQVGLGRALEKQGQRDQAERLYVAVAAKPDSPQADAAQFHLGAMHYEVGKYAEALTSFAPFDSRLAQSPWRPNARLGQGLTLLKLNRPAEAVKQFDAVLATADANEELIQRALRGNVQAALQLKDYDSLDRQAARFEKRFAASPFRGDVQRMLARSLVERRHYDRAAVLLKSLLTQPSPRQDLDSRYLLALSYEGLQHYDDALAAVLPVVAGASGDLKVQARLEQALLLSAVKQHREAIPLLEKCLAEHPSAEAEVKLLAALAISTIRVGQIDKSKRTYAELLAKYPKHPLIPPTTERLADAAYDANDTVWASELSGRLATLGDSAEYAFKSKLTRGWGQFKAGKLADAADTFDQLLQRHPPAPIAAEAALIRGYILERLGRSDQALAMYDLVIQRYATAPQHADAQLAAARLHSNLKHWTETTALCEKLTHDHPQFAELDAAIYEWAWALHELGKNDESLRLFSRLSKDFPNSRFRADAAYRVAQAAFDAKDYDRANQLVDALLSQQIAPQVRSAATYLRGQLAVAKRDWPKARQTFEKLVQDFPTASRCLAAETWIAEADYQQNDLAKASARLDRLADMVRGKHEPWMALVPFRRAQIAARREHWTDAYRIASSIETDFPGFEQQHDVDCLLGQCLAMQADFQAARRAYNKVIHSPTGAKTETAARAQWLIGESYFHQKNYQAALREYLKLEILYAFPSWQAAALFEAGKCHELLGEKKEAADVYRRILKVYPKSPLANDAGKRLNSLRQNRQPAKTG